MGLLISILLIALALAYFAAPFWAWFVALSVYLLVCNVSAFVWIPVGVLAVVLLHKKTRVKLITQNLFHFCTHLRR